MTRATVTYGSNPYAHPAALFDVVTGGGGSCTPSYLCNAGPGYDGPTGMGHAERRDGVRAVGLGSNWMGHASRHRFAMHLSMTRFSQ